MPNWCHNSMEIVGPVDEITRFKQVCLVVHRGEPALDFGAIVPVPDNPKFPVSRDWAIAHWGTDRDACYFQVIRDEPNSYECVFDTAWSPPVPVWRKLGEMFPTLEFSLRGYEPLMDFAFRGAIRDGKLELELLDAPVIWEIIDPKTGKTVSGTHEELGAVLRDDLEACFVPQNW
jgi:hypothetical protein